MARHRKTKRWPCAYRKCRPSADAPDEGDVWFVCYRCGWWRIDRTMPNDR